MNRNTKRTRNERDGISRTGELTLRLEERRQERLRIARELHDTLFQGFLGAQIHVQVAIEQLPEDSPGKTSLSRAVRLMKRVLDEGREALSGLRSSRAGLTSLEQGLAALHDEFSGDQLRFRIFVKGNSTELDPALREQIYMIGREALVNALRHSNGSSIETEIEYLASQVRLVVRDNGNGIDPKTVQSGSESHWGLAGMRERAESIGAKLRIFSKRGAGTEVELTVPITIPEGACA